MRLASTFATSGAVSIVSPIRPISAKKGITGISGDWPSPPLVLRFRLVKFNRIAPEEYRPQCALTGEEPVIDLLAGNCSKDAMGLCGRNHYPCDVI